jgi:hypothetical protein
MALIKPFKPRQSSIIINSKFSYTPLINTLFITIKQIIKLKTKEAFNI